MRSFLGSLITVAQTTGALLVLALVTLLVANVVAREIFSYPLVWANEIGLILFAWSVFIGAGVAFGAGSRIRFTLLTDKLSTKLNTVSDVTVSCIGLGVLSTLFMLACWFVSLSADQKLTSLDASSMWQTAGLPVGILVAIIGWVYQGPWGRVTPPQEASWKS
jgi:TRAP-type C4-dicarboxylate transport system permease small subunit